MTCITLIIKCLNPTPYQGYNVLRDIYIYIFDYQLFQCIQKQLSLSFFLENIIVIREKTAEKAQFLKLSRK
jgi:hypothetical protein